MELGQKLPLNLCVVGKNEGVKKVLLCSDSSFNLNDLFLCEKSFFLVRPADLILNLENGSVYLQEQALNHLAMLLQSIDLI